MYRLFNRYTDVVSCFVDSIYQRECNITGVCGRYHTLNLCLLQRTRMRTGKDIYVLIIAVIACALLFILYFSIYRKEKVQETSTYTVGDLRFSELVQRYEHMDEIAGLFNWTADRETLLRRKKSIKVLLVDYQRGGTSVIKSLLSCDKAANFWPRTEAQIFDQHFALHAPRDNVTGSRSVDSYIVRWYEYYDNLLNCLYNNVPLDVLVLGYNIDNSPRSLTNFMNCFGDEGRAKIMACRKHIVRCDGGNDTLTDNCHVVIPLTDKVMTNSKDIPLPNPRVLLAKLKMYLISMLLKLEPKLPLPLSSFIQYATCVELVKREHRTQQCLLEMTNSCTNQDNSLQVIEVNHLNFGDIRHLIGANPDLYVLHYTRDPRGIISSLLSTYKNYTSIKATEEAQLLCKKMAAAISTGNGYETMFPGSVKHVSFEDLSHDLEGMANEIYRTFDRDRPKCWEKFMFEHKDRNATATTDKWKSTLSSEMIMKINELQQCSKVIKTL